VIKKANISDIDKAFFLNEVTTWGKRLVWTDDYSNAIDALEKVRTKKDDTTFASAEAAINQIKNQYSKTYLLDELEVVRNPEKIKYIDDMDITVPLNRSYYSFPYYIPHKVTAKLYNGNTKEVPVTWKTIAGPSDQWGVAPDVSS
jgi:hypothetical protein